MGSKLLWTGLTLLEGSRVLNAIPAVEIVGAVIMVIGLIMYLLDR